MLCGNVCKLSCTASLPVLIYIILCDWVCVLQGYMDIPEVFIQFVVFTFYPKCMRYCLILECIFCNSVDFFFSQFFVNVLDKIAVALVADKISTVKGLFDNIVFVQHRLHSFHYRPSSLVFVFFYVP